MSFYAFMPKLFNMSLTASVAIVLVILLRLLLKKAPKVISYALWAVVLFRLLCPVSIGSSFSLYNLFDAPTEESGTVTSVIEYVPSNIVHTEYPSVALPVPGISDAINEALPKGEEQLRADPLEGPIFIATYVWMAGVLAMVIYSIVSYIRLRSKLSVVVPLWDNIFIADDIKSPFVVGLFRPKIYLPCNLGEQEQAYIILHEQHHIKRLDHVMKALAFLALAIHWFNPLVWMAFVLASKDMEMSCDEAVIRKVGSDVRADYSASLLTLATGRRIIAGTPLAFGEGDTKGRINNLSKWKKPAVWVVLIAVVACIILAVGLLTNPSDNKLHAPEPFCHSYRVKTIMYQDTRYSFGYTMDTAPRYQLTSDYQLFVAGDTFDGSEAGEWVQHHGAFEEIKLSGLRFDDYFKDPGNLSGWDGARYGAESIREQAKQAWRLEVDGNENGVFYYLILTHTDKVFLCYGYNTGDTYAAAEEDSLIRWVFELERTDLLTCNAVSDGINAFVELAFFPDTDIDRDTDNWPVAQINESGVLQFSLEDDANTLVVSEDYYRKSEDSTFIERNTFEIVRNDDGFFTIDISCRESLEDHVNYFIKIKGQSDVYAMKVVFTDEDTSPQLQFTGELIPGTTYVSYQCLYMNPLSSYAAMGGDSGCKYIVGEDYFATINRNDGSFVSVTNPNMDIATSGLDGLQNMIEVSRWEWQEFPYTDEEWAALYAPQGFGGVNNISEIYDEMLYQPLTAGKFLLKMDNSLWLVDLAANDQMGTYLWSIYSLVPESTMGVAQWEYAPMLSSRIPYFRFEFDMDYTEISAVCTQSPLVDFDAEGSPSDASLILKDDNALYWSPMDEDGNVVTAAIIHFSVHQNDIAPYSGTIYIEGNSGSDGRRIYNATIVGTGLHLEPHSEISGGVISAIASTNVVRVVEHDLTTGDLEVSVEDLNSYVFYTNSKQISVTVNGSDFDGQVNLLDVSQDNAHIMQHKVNTRDDDCLFTGLTSARLYRVDCEGLDGCTVVISGDK